MSLPNEVIISTSKLTALGDAIRSKTGGQSDLTLDEMATAVANIPSGGSSDILVPIELPLPDVTITIT